MGAAPIGRQRGGSSERPAFDGSDLDRTLGGAAPLAAMAATLPPAMSTTSPAPVAAPPPPTPTVSGTSHTGLTTTSDVSGRPDGGGARTGLSAGTAEPAIGKQAAGLTGIPSDTAG